MEITKQLKELDLSISSLRRKIVKNDLASINTQALKDEYYALLSERLKIKTKLHSNGYKLSKKALMMLKSDMNLRLTVANVMGVGLPAVEKSIKLGGKSIASHYDAVNILHDKTGVLINELRETQKK